MTHSWRPSQVAAAHCCHRTQTKREYSRWYCTGSLFLLCIFHCAFCCVPCPWSLPFLPTFSAYGIFNFSKTLWFWIRAHIFAVIVIISPHGCGREAIIVRCDDGVIKQSYHTDWLRWKCMRNTLLEAINEHYPNKMKGNPSRICLGVNGPLTPPQIYDPPVKTFTPFKATAQWLTHPSRCLSGHEHKQCLPHVIPHSHWQMT